MLRNLFDKIFHLQSNEQLQMEKTLKSMTINDVIREVENKKEDKQEITSTMVEEKEQVILNEGEAEKPAEPEIQENEKEEIQESIEDAPEVSEDTEVQEEPKNDAEGDEPAEEAETVETKEEEKEEEKADEQPIEQEEPQEDSVEVEEKEEEPKAEEGIEQADVPAIENSKVVDSTSKPVAEIKVSMNESLLKEIETLKAENAKKDLELEKLNLSKEVEADYAGLPASLDEKVDLVFEIKNSQLSEDTKTFILNSLKSLSTENLKSCQEIGHSQEVDEIDEKDEMKKKIENAINEHGLTENQAFLFVNGDRTLAQAKKASEKVKNKRK